jgi:hypothetical protein
VFSPDWREMAAAAGLCFALVVAVVVAKRTGSEESSDPRDSPLP